MTKQEVLGEALASIKGSELVAYAARHYTSAILEWDNDAAGDLDWSSLTTCDESLVSVSLHCGDYCEAHAYQDVSTDDQVLILITLKTWVDGNLVSCSTRTVAPFMQFRGVQS